MKCAEREKDKELLCEQAAQITGLENAKNWLERRLNEAEVCLGFWCIISIFPYYVSICIIYIEIVSFMSYAGGK